jgi:transposase-like protein
MEEQEIKTLQEAVIYFADYDNCHSYMVARRWPLGITCPRCGGDKVKYQPKYRRWQCAAHHPRRQFTIKTGTIFEDSPLPMQKWLPAVWFVVNCKNGISSYEIHRALGVTQKTAWFMLQRIRLAMQASPFVDSMSGQIEADETYIGGKARNMHADKKAAKGNPRGSEGKTIVAAVLARHGEVRAQVVTHRRKWQLQNMVIENVAEGSELFTDALPSYSGLDKPYVHQVIDHAEAYVRGNVHTNGLENFWSLLKRSINGTYISVEPFHLFRYVDEQAFRYNNRKKMNDYDRFHKAVNQTIGKRVTYKELTGKEGETNV